MFDPVILDDGYFEGFCIRLDVEGTNYWYLVKTNGPNGCSEDAMRYYLKNVLEVPVMTKTNNIGNASLHTSLKSVCSVSNDGFIYGNFSEIDGKNPIATAAWNSWGYPQIFTKGHAFDTSVFYSTLRQKDAIKEYAELISLFGQPDPTDDSSMLDALGFSAIDNVKVVFNSNTISPYFDGGQFGLVQLQSEYLVMADLVDFMCQEDLTLYMMNANSQMIDWTYSNEYSAADTQWVGSATTTALNKTGTDHELYNSEHYSKYYGSRAKNSNLANKIPFVVSYTDLANDVDAGNTLYLADATASSEKEGALFIMCYKVVEGTTTKYVPILHRESFTNPINGQTYNFSSKFLSSNYNGVIIARGIMDTSSTDVALGLPTYIEESAKNKKDEYISTGDYYYEMLATGEIKMYAKHGIFSNVNQDNVKTQQLTDGFSYEYDAAGAGDANKIYLNVGNVCLKNNNGIYATKDGDKFQFLTTDKISLSKVNLKGTNYELGYNSDDKKYQFSTNESLILSSVIINETYRTDGYSDFRGAVDGKLTVSNKTASFSYETRKPNLRNANILDIANITLKYISGYTYVGDTRVPEYTDVSISKDNHVNGNLYVVDLDGTLIFFRLNISSSNNLEFSISINNQPSIGLNDVDFEVTYTDGEKKEVYNNGKYVNISGTQYALNYEGNWYFFKTTSENKSVTDFWAGNYSNRTLFGLKNELDSGNVSMSNTQVSVKAYESFVEIDTKGNDDEADDEEVIKYRELMGGNILDNIYNVTYCGNNM